MCTPSLTVKSKEGPSRAGVRGEGLLSLTARSTVSAAASNFHQFSSLLSVNSPNDKCKMLRWQKFYTSFCPHVKTVCKKNVMFRCYSNKNTLKKYCITSNRSLIKNEKFKWLQAVWLSLVLVCGRNKTFGDRDHSDKLANEKKGQWTETQRERVKINKKRET